VYLKELPNEKCDAALMTDNIWEKHPQRLVTENFTSRWQVVMHATVYWP
jgi:hypothetical protein